MTNVAVEVPISEQIELTELMSSIDRKQAHELETRALDGETIVAAIITVSIPTIALLKAWLLARVERGKGTVVRANGRIYRAYSASDVIKLERFLNQDSNHAPEDS